MEAKIGRLVGMQQHHCRTDRELALYLALDQIVWKLSHSHADGVGRDAGIWPARIDRNDISIRVARLVLEKNIGYAQALKEVR